MSVKSPLTRELRRARNKERQALNNLLEKLLNERDELIEEVQTLRNVTAEVG